MTRPPKEGVNLNKEDLLWFEPILYDRSARVDPNKSAFTSQAKPFTRYRQKRQAAAQLRVGILRRQYKRRLMKK